MIKKRRKSKKYFTKGVHEKAILEYIDSADLKKRNELYVTIIQPAFFEMVNKIVYKYKFASLPNIKSLIQECETHLVTILSKFDREKGSKAFSYFSVITKNWFIHKAKKYALQCKKEIQHEEISKPIEIEYLSTCNHYVEDRIKKEFLNDLLIEIDRWGTLELKSNEEKVLYAIKILLKSADELEIFNKKAIYIYSREITNLNTKQILSALNKFRSLYKDFRNRWLNDNT